MTYFRNLKMRTKLFGGFLLIIFLSLVVASIAIVAINTTIKVENQLKVSVSHDMRKTIILSAAYNDVHAWLHQLQAHPSVEMARKGLDYVAVMEDLTKKALAGPKPTTFGDLATSNRQNMLLLAEKIKGRFIELYLDGKFKEADSVFMNEVLGPLSQSNRNFSQLIEGYAGIVDDQVSLLNMRSYMYVIITVTAIAVLAALAICFALANYIVKHTHNIKDIAAQIENGNFQLHIRKEDIPNDEIGDIYKSYVEISDTLSNTISRVVGVSEMLRKYSNDLNQASWSINDGAKHAETQSLTVAAAADEMVSTTADIAKNCHIASETSEVARNETNNGVDKVRSTVASIKEQSVFTREDAEKVMRLAEQSQKIGSIVGTIDEIAAQTNLLALNAAIEAARAGEAGRGFAVVAAEVRALASRTSKSTQEITAMVRSIQEDSKTATDSMNESVVQMESVAERAGELESTLNTIMSSVNDVNSQISQIATAAEEQTTATSEISSNMQGITEIAQNFNDVSNNAVNVSNISVKLIDNIIKELDFFSIDQARMKTVHENLANEFSQMTEEGGETAAQAVQTPQNSAPGVTPMPV